MNKPRHTILSIACLALMWCGALTSCSDEPDSEHFYTFTGEMASDYLKNRSETFSEFTEIVNRAGLMDLLSTYGHYTCFVPTNDAVNAYLQSKGIPSVSSLTDADCDTIARTQTVWPLPACWDDTSPPLRDSMRKTTPSSTWRASLASCSRPRTTPWRTA